MADVAVTDHESPKLQGCRTVTFINSSILTMFPPMTIVLGASMMELWELPLKSMLTSSSSQYSRMPFSGPAAAFFKACVDLLHGDLFFHVADKVDDGDGGRGHAEGQAVNLAFERRE